MAYKVDMSLPPAVILLGIINYENPRAKLTFQEVKFSEKGVENVRYYVKGILKTDYMGDHCKIDLVPLPGSRLYHTTTIYFNRINLTDYLAGHPLIITPGQYTDTSELLDESILRKSLFWDTEIHNIDWNKQSKAVINRIFERGNEEEKKEIERFYGKRKVETILNSRKTKPMQLHKLHP